MRNQKYFQHSWMKGIATSAIFMFCLQAQAESSIGFVLGNPTGLSGRFSLDNKYSLSTTIANHGGDNDGLEIQISILKDNARRFQVEGQPMEFYYGAGLRLIDIDGGKHKNKMAIAIRGPVGVTFDIKNPDLQFFAELAPNLNLTPYSDVDFDLGIGARFRF